MMIVGGVAGIGLMALAGPAVAFPVEPVLAVPLPLLVQADPPRPVQPQAKPAQGGLQGGLNDRQLLQNPELRQQMMDDPRFQALMQDAQVQRLMASPQVQQQMQRNPQLRQLYQLNARPLPGVSADDDD
jgi:hypothetical protein